MPQAKAPDKLGLLALLWQLGLINNPIDVKFPEGATAGKKEDKSFNLESMQQLGNTKPISRRIDPDKFMRNNMWRGAAGRGSGIL